MRRLLYLVTAITLIAALGVILIGCSCSRPSNVDIKQAIIAYEGSLGIYLTQADIEIEKVKMRTIPAQMGTVTYFSVKVSIRGFEAGFLLHKNYYGVWEAMPLQ
jgi:hypothetical protein